MASRSALRFVLSVEPWRPVHLNQTSVFVSLRARINPSPRLSGKLGTNIRVREFYSAKRSQLNCSNNGTPSSSSQDDQGPPQEAVLKAISGFVSETFTFIFNFVCMDLSLMVNAEVSKTEGRVGQTTNVVIGGTVTNDSSNEWLELDQKVNSYPSVRDFTAIGTGGDDFVQAMVVAVESVIQRPIPKGHVKQKLSSRGKYVSVNIGPIKVVSSEQVQEVYNAMRRDDRMKYFL